MKVAISFLLVTNLLVSCALHKSKPVQNQILEILDDPKTEFFYTSDKIPEAMMTRVKEISEKEISYNDEFAMANPAEDFNESCVKNENLLSRRLVFLAKHSNEYVLCYERGGRAHNLLISFSKIKNDRTTYYNLSLSGIPENEYSNQDSIKSALRTGNYLLTYNNGQATKRQYVAF